MYVIVVYDCNVKRVNKVRKFLKRYLNWVQNSVFEGELTKVQYLQVKQGVVDIIEKEEDCVFFYSVKSQKYMKFEEMGTRKVDIDVII